MPEAVRDQRYIAETIEKIKDLQAAADTYTKNNKAFIGRFAHDAKLQAMLPYLAFGQEQAEIDYKKLADHIDLRQEQHPPYAVSGASGPSGNCVHVLGEEGLKIGNALVLRQPDGSIRYRNGKLTYSADAFFALAKMKGLSAAFHMKSADNAFIEALYYMKKYGDEDIYNFALTKKLGEEKAAKLRKFVKTPAVADYIENGSDLFDEVQKKGFEHYENLLVVDDEDYDILQAAFKNRKDAGHEENTDSRYIRAMEIQEAIWDYEAIVRSGYKPDDAIVVFQGRITNHQYAWNPDLARFILIPDLDEDSPHYEAQKKRFIGRLPRRKEYRQAAEALMQGARLYRRMRALEIDIAESNLSFIDPDVVCCSDSRSLTQYIIYNGADHLRTAFRNPGAFVSRDGKMMSDSERFFAHAELRGKTVLISPHANCGAETAIDAYFDGNGDNLPDAFVRLAEHRKKLVRTVLNKGKEPDDATPIDVFREVHQKEEIIAHYSALTNIPLKTIADCLSVQQLLWDFETAKRDFANVHTVAVFQNMTECQNYVLNTATMKFEAIIPASIRTEPKPKLPQAACACCGGVHKLDGAHNH